MESMDKRIRSDGKISWVAWWRDPAGRQRKHTFARKVDAERYLIGVEHSANAGSYVDPARSTMTLGEWATPWMAGDRISNRRHWPRTYQSLLRTRVLPTWVTCR